MARASVASGLGAWWDVYDWSPSFVASRNRAAVPPLRLADVDRLAREGVQTLYIQTAANSLPAHVLDPTLLRQIRDRARALGMRVVAWTLPEHRSLQHDLDRLVGAARFGFDGVGFNIESTANPNIADRNQKLLAAAKHMREAFPGLPLLAIPVTPIIWEELNRTWWPNFPYKQLVPYFDVWMPMAYWSYRSVQSGWRDPYRYTYESVMRTRSLTGTPGLPVHPIGGEATGMTGADAFWMNVAMTDSGSIGGSVYDDVITSADLWGALRLMRRDPVVK